MVPTVLLPSRVTVAGPVIEAANFAVWPVPFGTVEVQFEAVDQLPPPATFQVGTTTADRISNVTKPPLAPNVYVRPGAWLATESAPIPDPPIAPLYWSRW